MGFLFQQPTNRALFFGLQIKLAIFTIQPQAHISLYHQPQAGPRVPQSNLCHSVWLVRYHPFCPRSLVLETMSHLLILLSKGGMACLMRTLFRVLARLGCHFHFPHDQHPGFTLCSRRFTPWMEAGQGFQERSYHGKVTNVILNDLMGNTKNNASQIHDSQPGVRLLRAGLAVSYQ